MARLLRGGAPAQARLIVVDEVSELRRFADRLSSTEPALHFFPIRHHSPACAAHLVRALRELAPRHVLIEMPSDFAHLIPLLVDPGLRPPAAIVAMLEGAQAEQAATIAYWPLSATAPEYAAIRAATACGATITFCDLPAGDRKEARRRAAPDEGEPRPGDPIVLTDDALLDHSSYVRALVHKTGCRDFNELWDRLFESRLADADWRRFFGDVGAYCALARKTYGADELERDDTLRRERFMARCLARVRETTQGPFAVVTGGFHTPALVDGVTESGPVIPSRSAIKSYLVRFSHQRLDALNGYAAGMPSPRYYELLGGAAERGAANPFQAVAEEVFLDLVALLRSQRPGFAPSVPAIVETLRHAAGLAELRGLPGPLRSELLDAARAALVKDEDARFGTPLLEELALRLTGTGIGDVPPGAGSPPLVEAARRRARSLGFTVTESVPRRRELDIHRNRQHRDGSRFLHAMAIIGADFGRLEHGADYSIGVDLDTLFEVWSYAWSPLVEARLIEAAADGDTVEKACASALRRKARKLVDRGLGRNAAEVSGLLFDAARAGLGAALMSELLQLVESEVAEDAELARVSTALRNLLLLWCARPVLGLSGEARLGGILGACYRRAVFLLASIAATKPEQVAETAQALVAIRDIQESAAELPEIDPAQFVDAIDALVDAELPPLLAGVVVALAVQFGRRPVTFLADRVAGALAGAAVEASDAAAPLAGLLMVSPALLHRTDEVVAAVDRAIGALDEARFVAVLPHLRAAFTVLAPGETEVLGGVIAARHGLAPGELEIDRSVAISEAELQRNLLWSRELVRLWQDDGLDAWLPEKAE
jgi:uncharacterized protein DUF5682